MESEILHNPVFWVSVSFILFMALSIKKVSKILVNTLDSRSAKITKELEEAKKLRVDAENVLADYKKKQAEYLVEAERMLTKAREEAEIFTKQAEDELQTSLDNRMKQALDKIEQEEAKAIDEVRHHVVDISLAAARVIITKHVGNISQDELVKVVVGDIERKIH